MKSDAMKTQTQKSHRTHALLLGSLVLLLTAGAMSQGVGTSGGGATTTDPGSFGGPGTGTTTGTESVYGGTQGVTDTTSDSTIGTTDTTLDDADMPFGDEGDYNTFSSPDPSFGDFPPDSSSSGMTTPDGYDTYTENYGNENYGSGNDGGAAGTIPNDSTLPRPTPFDDFGTGTDFDTNTTGP